MPLQNRVTPFGDLIATPERGTLLGNRGVLHDDHKTIVRSSQLRRWICCVLEWKGKRRPLMKPRTWTELFFLDEATAFAAGHRPCFECRRQAALDFQSAWVKVFGAPARADAMDRVLEADRRLRGGAKKTWTSDPGELPEGAFIARDGAAWLVRGGRRWRWTAGGYDRAEEIGGERVEVLTPRSTVAVLRAGYAVGVHPSATARG